MMTKRILLWIAIQLCVQHIVVGFEDKIIGSLRNGNIRLEIENEHIWHHVADESGKQCTIAMECKQLLQETEAPQITQVNEMFRAEWSSGLTLIVTSDSNQNHAKYEWLTNDVNDYIEVGFSFDIYNWYGGPERFVQQWTVQNMTINETAFLPNEVNGGVVDRYFLSSAGIAISGDPTTPLFLRTFNNSFFFKAELKAPYRIDQPYLSLGFEIVTGFNLVNTHRNSVFFRLLGTPSGAPLEAMFRYPIWSTWAYYKTSINQSTVLQFADEITKHGFPNSQIEIDDNWETCYGSQVFNPVTFPDPKGMVDTLTEKGYNVTIWVHPFCNYDCPTYEEGNKNNYLVTSDGFNVTGEVEWWNGKGGIIDITKPEAAEWWAQRLDKLRNDIGITSFKFDAGETHFLPSNSFLYNVSLDLQPGEYSTEYATFAAQFGGRVEVRSGYRSQNLSVFVRMLDRDSRWGLDNGLHSVLTSTLHFGLIGYPFVLPDMIGGNAYGTEYPDRELYIRWMQLNAFLPSLQFSIPPWAYDDEVVTIARNLVALHDSITHLFLEAAEQSTLDGTPIIRPLWWMVPDDDLAQIIDDQFLVADKLLVAPIIEKGATKRDIYLPQGTWNDELRSGHTYEGPMWLHDYEVQLNETTYFTRVDVY